MKTSAQIKEIFTSIQGEGPFIGYEQLFIRFSGCNLRCEYCDTNHRENTICFTPKTLLEAVEKFDIKKVHSISLTGGEPLIHTAFLKEFLPLTDKKIYLETNGTLPEALEIVGKNIDIAAVDIKLNSVSNQGNLFETHKRFIEVAKKNNIETFVKIVFDKNIELQEIKTSAQICKQCNVPLIIQPVMRGNKLKLTGVELSDILEEFLGYYKNVRLIPQVHKFIKVE